MRGLLPTIALGLAVWFFALGTVSKPSEFSPSGDGGNPISTPSHAEMVMQISDLNETIVTSLFEMLTNEDDFRYAFSIASSQIGAFTTPGDTEALVQIHDGNQCHASRMNELWLLRFREEREAWTLVTKIAESDVILYQAMDVDVNSVHEIWLEEMWGN